MASPPIAIREPRETDLPWMYSTFIRSMSNQQEIGQPRECRACGGPIGPIRPVEPHLMSAMLHGLCTRIMRQGRVAVACDPKDPDQMYGWIAWRDNTLLWVFTKYDFRGNGVGTALVAHAFGSPREPFLCAIMTSSGRHLVGKWGMVDAPWALKEKP